MSYREAIGYLKSFINYETIPLYPYKKSLKLERIRDFLELLGNPQDSLRCIHVAGTKGKGSTCAFIAYILRDAGYKIGLYTSPHLSDFRERIRILRPQPKRGSQGLIEFEGMIPKADLVALTKRLRPFVEKYNKGSAYGPLSFFEVYTALAFLYFKEKKADFAVLETGLGGRLDATNVVNPLVCVITPISYEHTQKLGSTLKEIASEKAGIIKTKPRRYKGQHLVVISAPQEKEAREVIRKRCSQAGARLYEVPGDISYSKGDKCFSIKGAFGEYPGLRISLKGGHQLVNATVAFAAVEGLRHYNIDVGIGSARRGLYNTLWPGRCEVVSSRPLVVLDGAQNIASAQALRKAIKENFSYRKLILVLGISSDKDIEGVTGELDDLADEVILTRADNPRATAPQDLAKYFAGKKIYITSGVKEAARLASSLARREDLVLVTGSLFVVGEYRNDKMRFN